MEVTKPLTTSELITLSRKIVSSCVFPAFIDIQLQQKQIWDLSGVKCMLQTVYVSVIKSTLCIVNYLQHWWWGMRQCWRCFKLTEDGQIVDLKSVRTHQWRRISSDHAPVQSKCSSSCSLLRAVLWRFGSPHRSGHPQYIDLQETYRHRYRKTCRSNKDLIVFTHLLFSAACVRLWRIWNLLRRRCASDPRTDEQLYHTWPLTSSLREF